MFGLYIHIPFCVSKCNYCDFNSYKMDKKIKDRYLKDLKVEMNLYKNDAKEVTSIFIGGGTPSILTSEEIKDLFESITENFNIKKDAEITIECNPGTLTLEKLKTMKEVGINRLSMGLQATQNYHLKSIGRIHTYEEFEKNYKQALQVGFENINIDLMYALPNQKTYEWKETLEKIVNLKPAHISAYSLILEEGTKLYEMYENNEFRLTDEDVDIKMYNYTIEYLKSNGYTQYEISNYSKDGYECIHNILYWKCENYIGLGAGASGYIKDIRYSNVNSLEDYHEKIILNQKPIGEIETLSIEDKTQEKIFMGLRMNEGIKFIDFKKEFKIDFEGKYNNVIKALLTKELIKKDENGIRLTQKGREISNSIFIEFMD